VLERKSRWLAATLGAALVIQAVISPETAYCLPAAGLAILAADVYATGWRRSALRLTAFTTTLWTALGGFLVGVVLILLLLSQHALPAFINYYTTFVPGHSLSGPSPTSRTRRGSGVPSHSRRRRPRHPHTGSRSAPAVSGGGTDPRRCT
jgi:hypothetical protein